MFRVKLIVFPHFVISLILGNFGSVPEFDYFLSFSLHICIPELKFSLLVSDALCQLNERRFWNSVRL